MNFSLTKRFRTKFKIWDRNSGAPHNECVIKSRYNNTNNQWKIEKYSVCIKHAWKLCEVSELLILVAKREAVIVHLHGNCV